MGVKIVVDWVALPALVATRSALSAAHVANK